MAPFLAAASAKKHKAAPGDLNPPMWPGGLDLEGAPDKLTIFLAARARYTLVCELSNHVPQPVAKAFDAKVVPTLRCALESSRLRFT